MFDRLKSIAKNVRTEIKVWKLVLKDRRIPLFSKILLGIAIAYALSPIDIIPDFIPALGYLDDLILVSLLVVLALKIIPKEVVEECRIRAQTES